MTDRPMPQDEVSSTYPRRIALLFGGASPEHEVSIASAAQAAEGLAAIEEPRRPLSIQLIYINREGDWIWAPAPRPGVMPRKKDVLAAEQWEIELEQYAVEILSFSEGLARLADEPIDAAILILHGQNGEDGRLQGALDLAGIPYTGSGASASALAFDKPRCQAVLNAAGLPIAPSTSMRAGGLEGAERIFKLVGLPCVIKPARGGSSVGISIVTRREELPEALKQALEIDAEVMAERFVKGREFTCGLLDREGELMTLPVTEIIPPDGRFFDYEAKYEAGVSREVTPAQISPGLTVEIQTLSHAAHRALGCRGFSRVDLIADVEAGSGPIILEVNTLPGMTATSLLPQGAAAQGIAFPELLSLMLASARHD